MQQRERRASRRTIERAEMFARMARVSLPQLCEQVSDGRTAVPHALHQDEADRLLQRARAAAGERSRADGTPK